MWNDHILSQNYDVYVMKEIYKCFLLFANIYFRIWSVGLC